MNNCISNVYVIYCVNTSILLHIIIPYNYIPYYIPFICVATLLFNTFSYY